VIRASVCLFVCPLAHFKNHISESRNFLQYACCLRPWLGPGHIVSSRPYSGAVAIRYVYTPGFADDVMFANSRPAEVKATHKRSSQTDSPGATSGRKQSLTPDDCLVKDRFYPFSSTCLEYDHIRSVVEKSAFVPGWQQKWKRKNSDMFVA